MGVAPSMWEPGDDVQINVNVSTKGLNMFKKCLPARLLSSQKAVWFFK